MIPRVSLLDVITRVCILDVMPRLYILDVIPRVSLWDVIPRLYLSFYPWLLFRHLSRPFHPYSDGRDARDVTMSREAEA